MKKGVILLRSTLIVLCITFLLASCQTSGPSLKPDGFPEIHNQKDLREFAVTLPLGITEKDDIKTIMDKVKKYLDNYKCTLPDDYNSLMADKAALDGCYNGQYGIGAILVNPEGKIVETAYNSMLKEKRSDLHGEMTLMTKFESNPANDVYRNGFTMKKGYVVFSSAEPCPMCMIRLATAGVDTKYNCKNDTDSMTRYLDNFPSFWKKLCQKHPCVQADCSKDLSEIAYLLFYLSYYQVNHF